MIRRWQVISIKYIRSRIRIPQLVIYQVTARCTAYREFRSSIGIVLILIYIRNKLVFRLIIRTEIVFGITALELCWQAAYSEVDLVNNWLVEFRLLLNSINTSCCTVFILERPLHRLSVAITAVTKHRTKGVRPRESVICWLVRLKNTFGQQVRITILVQCRVRISLYRYQVVRTIAVVGINTILAYVALLVHGDLRIHIEGLGTVGRLVTHCVCYTVIVATCRERSEAIVARTIYNTISSIYLRIEDVRTILRLSNLTKLSLVSTHNVVRAIARIEIVLERYRVTVFTQRPARIVLIYEQRGVVRLHFHRHLVGFGATTIRRSVLRHNPHVLYVVAVLVILISQRIVRYVGREGIRCFVAHTRGTFDVRFSVPLIHGVRICTSRRSSKRHLLTFTIYRATHIDRRRRGLRIDIERYSLRLTTQCRCRVSHYRYRYIAR